MPITTAVRHQDIDAGHRVPEQGGACERLHGHSYRVYFMCSSDTLNSIGMVLDFSVMKTRLCEWLLHKWDHRTLIWIDDPWLPGLLSVCSESIVLVPFRPTAENIAEYLLNTIGPQQLEGTGVKLTKVIVEETRKCSASAEL